MQLILKIKSNIFQYGFTLIEFILVIALLSILAVFFTPHIFSNDDFNAKGFHDETLAVLRYAQKTAVAQRRTVCLTFGPDTVTLSIASLAGTATCNTVLRGPKGDSPGAITAKSGIRYDVNPIDLSFDGLGQPMNSSEALVTAQMIQIRNATNTITVEAVTGYVHD